MKASCRCFIRATALAYKARMLKAGMLSYHPSVERRGGNRLYMTAQTQMSQGLTSGSRATVGSYLTEQSAGPVADEYHGVGFRLKAFLQVPSEKKARESGKHSGYSECHVNGSAWTTD